MKSVLLVGLLVVAASAASKELLYPVDSQWTDVRQPDARLEPVAPFAPVAPVQQPAAPFAAMAPVDPFAPVVPRDPEVLVDAPHGPHGVPVVLPEGVTFGPDGPTEEDEERFGFWGGMMGWGWGYPGWGRR